MLTRLKLLKMKREIILKRNAISQLNQPEVKGYYDRSKGARGMKLDEKKIYKRYSPYS